MIYSHPSWLIIYERGKMGKHPSGNGESRTHICPYSEPSAVELRSRVARLFRAVNRMPFLLYLDRCPFPTSELIIWKEGNIYGGKNPEDFLWVWQRRWGSNPQSQNQSLLSYRLTTPSYKAQASLIRLQCKPPHIEHRTVLQARVKRREHQFGCP